MLVHVARLYYERELGQAEIADLLDISRSNVSRMLAAARRRGIVEITINDPADQAQEVEAMIARRFGLRECRVAAAADAEGDPSAVGLLAAQWLVANLPRGGGIGLSWGATLQSMVSQVDIRPDHGNLEVLPLVGGFSPLGATEMGEEIVRDLADRIGSSRRRLFAPAIVESRVARDTLAAEPSISSVLRAAATVRVAFVGIGSAGLGASQAVVDRMRLDRREREAFERARPVGDMCARFYDRFGQPVRSPAEGRIIGLSLKELHRIPTVVGVAAGAGKLPGVMGAVRSGILDVLIVDRALADALLAIPEARARPSENAPTGAG